ncbi:MAG: hypothetical protein J1E38_02965 [Paramuribaculum sp.]|nr:hypothetical protein [Paramuribaculum sp.]
MKNLCTLLFGIAILASGRLEISAQGMGSAGELKGKIYVLSIFITDREWPKQERERLRQKQYEAEEWIRQKAAEYGSDISFVNGNFGYDKPIYIKPLPISYDSPEQKPVDLTYRLMKEIGWENPSKFPVWAKEKAGCDQALAIIYTNSYGRGYSVKYNDLYSAEKYFFEGAVLFKGYNETQSLYPASIAHEMLHLFGAIDLYEVTESDAERAGMASRAYADDIMRRIPYDIKDAKLGDLTAWLVGIGPYKPSFAPYLNK